MPTRLLFIRFTLVLRDRIVLTSLDKLDIQTLKLGTHYPCPRAVDTGAQNDARVHGPSTRPVNKNDTHVHEAVLVNTGRVHMSI